MNLSLFRKNEMIYFFIMYLICYIINISLLKIDYILIDENEIFRGFADLFIILRIPISIIFSFVIVLLHYQFFVKKKVEIVSRFIVGDTMQNIRKRFLYCHSILLVASTLISFTISLVIGINISESLYLFLLFSIYILISLLGVKFN
ncbi:hypothetical protein HMPREF3029_03050 [Nosocomiicoccus sp. HMSC059G07]|nr:hypothetical protein HMPREF3029_03050 [Nosocomiicoccus sp. HMSC059G07]